MKKLAIDAEAFLSANTFYCERTRARITHAQCAINRQKPSLKEKNQGQHSGKRGSRGIHPDTASPYLDYKPFPCESCPGYESQKEENPAAIPAGKREVLMAKSTKMGLCPECNQNKLIKSRGLCDRCYGTMWANKTLNKKYPSTQKITSHDHPEPLAKNLEIHGDLAISHIVVLNFTNFEDLLDRLNKRALKEFRPLKNQILFELQKVMV